MAEPVSVPDGLDRGLGLLGDDPAVGDGGPHYPEFLQRVRELMDRAKAANPTDEVARSAIEQLAELNALLSTVEVGEWDVPAWRRNDLPAPGSITVPPALIDHTGTDEVRGRITFSRYHLGGNGAVHGGQISLLFDHILGLTTIYGAQTAARTAYLTTSFRSITPIDRELDVRGWIDRIEGRKIYLRGELRDGDRVCADAEAMFLKLLPGQQ